MVPNGTFGVAKLKIVVLHARTSRITLSGLLHLLIMWCHDFSSGCIKITCVEVMFGTLCFILIFIIYYTNSSQIISPGKFRISMNVRILCQRDSYISVSPSKSVSIIPDHPTLTNADDCHHSVEADTATKAADLTLTNLRSFYWLLSKFSPFAMVY